MTFSHDDSLVFPKLKQVNLDTGRVYQVESGEYAGDVFPGITRLLGTKPKPQLEAWKKKKGPVEAGIIAARAAVRGNGIHRASECYLGNQDMPTIWPHVAELWQHLRPWLTAHITTVYAQEQDLVSFYLGVGGRTDVIADVDGVFSIVDFKQADRPKKEEHIEDYYLQGTFYACAVYEATGRAVKRIVFPITSPEGTVVFETTPAKHFDALRSRVDEFYTSVLTLDSGRDILTSVTC